MAERFEEDGDAPARLALPNVRHLRIVDAVGRHSSISRAAAEVNLSQPAVTQAIARLEAQVGRPLFARRQNGTFATPAGEAYLHRVRRFLDQCEEAVLQLDPARADPTLVRRITSPQIRGLLAIARSVSFSQAARIVGISTASLHRAARELEANLGVPLYRPSRFGLTLTRSGLELARRIGLAIREIEAAADDLRYLDGVESGRIAIGTLPLSGSYLIGAVITDLTQRFPEASVSISSGTYDLSLNSLRTGAIDMVFGILRRPEWLTDIQEEPLFSDPYCIIGRAGHPLAERDAIELADLVAFEWIAPSRGTPRRRQFEALFEGAERRPATSIETSSLATIRAVLASSDRLTLVNRHEVETEERTRMFSVLSWTPSVPPMAKGLTTRTNWLPTPIQRRFLTLLRTHARRAADQTGGVALAE